MDDDLKKLSEELFQELKKRNLNLSLTSLTVKALEELGEVGDLALRKEGGQRKKKHLSDREIREKLGKEVSDTIISLIMLAKLEGIDIVQKLEEVMKEEIERWGDED